MKESSLLTPIRFRFAEPDDAKAYGDDWRVYDEAQIVRLPARELVKLEIELGMQILDVFQGMRSESVLGYLGGTWLALRIEDPDVAGPFDDYSPVAMLIEWEPVPASRASWNVPGTGSEDMGGPLEQTASPDSPPAG